MTPAVKATSPWSPDLFNYLSAPLPHIPLYICFASTTSVGYSVERNRRRSWRICSEILGKLFGQPCVRRFAKRTQYPLWACHFSGVLFPLHLKACYCLLGTHSISWSSLLWLLTLQSEWCSEQLYVGLPEAPGSWRRRPQPSAFTWIQEYNLQNRHFRQTSPDYCLQTSLGLVLHLFLSTTQGEEPLRKVSWQGKA